MTTEFEEEEKYSRLDRLELENASNRRVVSYCACERSRRTDK